MSNVNLSPLLKQLNVAHPNINFNQPLYLNFSVCVTHHGNESIHHDRHHDDHVSSVDDHTDRFCPIQLLIVFIKMSQALIIGEAKQRGEEDLHGTFVAVGHIKIKLCNLWSCGMSWHHTANKLDNVVTSIN